MPHIVGTPGNDTLVGTPDADLLEGLAGDDLLFGLEGVDTTDGGSGNDQHFVQDAGDIVVERAGEGDDRLVASVDYTLGAGVHVETMTTANALGTAAIDLTGNELAQSIFGNAGNNILGGGGGADYLVGLHGHDTYLVDDPLVVIAEAAGEGDDEVITSVSYALAEGAWVETLRTSNAASTAALTLIGNDLEQSIYGNAGNNVLIGGGGNDFLVGQEGNDYLSGGAGTDTMMGGAGNDTFTIDLAVGDVVIYRTNPTNTAVTSGATATVVAIAGDSVTIELDLGNGTSETRTVPISEIYAGDTVLENDGEGDDVIVASASYILRNDAVEVLVAVEGTADITLRGNYQGDSIYGNAGHNVLHGEGGNDYLVGLGGNDSLFGGTGNDALLGGDGNDLLVGDNGFFSAVADFMAGGPGDDQYWSGGADQIVENVGEGFDTVLITARDSASPGVATLFLAPGTEIEQIIGSTGGSQLRIHGSEFTQTIIGENNHDVLWSGGGAGTLDGRGGNDIYHLSSGLETIIEAAGGGTDAAFVSADFTLNAGAHVETISTTWQYGNDGIDIIGNEVGQRIIGNFGSNVLDGGGGSDTLIGLGGADIYRFTTALGPANVDRIIEFSSGVDTIALDDAIFAALSPGQLPAGAFSTGTAATEADDRIIYNPETGQLFYDADGVGGAAAIQFAVLQDAPPLQGYDFLII